ncbi:hypothetical protein H4582DRAFT_2080025 [Lactarius indigo]|nr:hypothetical protein H4582DRAFT_2080025 [Lactarius indigo]
MIENFDELFTKFSRWRNSPRPHNVRIEDRPSRARRDETGLQDPVLGSKDSEPPEVSAYLGGCSSLLTRDDVTESLDEVRSKYDEFVGLLNNTEDLDIPESYISLLKLAGQVRRPFQSQAIALISLCRMLVTEFEKDTHHTSDNLVTLEEALNATHKGLQEAIVAVAGLKTFNLDNFEEHPAYKALKSAQKYIKACHNTFALGNWSREELNIDDAVRKDKERMDWLNKLLQTRPPLAGQGKVEQLELTIAVYDESTSTSNHVHQTTFLVEGSTRLSAVRWTVAGTLTEPLRKRVRQDGEFRHVSDGDTEYELHDTVSKVAGSKKKCALRLIV